MRERESEKEREREEEKGFLFSPKGKLKRVFLFYYDEEELTPFLFLLSFSLLRFFGFRCCSTS